MDCPNKFLFLISHLFSECWIEWLKSEKFGWIHVRFVLTIWWCLSQDPVPSPGKSGQLNGHLWLFCCVLSHHFVFCILYCYILYLCIVLFIVICFYLLCYMLYDVPIVYMKEWASEEWMNAIPTELSCGYVPVTHTISGFEIMQHPYKPFEQWWLLYALKFGAVLFSSTNKMPHHIALLIYCKFINLKRKFGEKLSRLLWGNTLHSIN